MCAARDITLIHNQPKQAIQFILLLISLGRAAGIATGTAGFTTSVNYYHSLSKDIIESLEVTAGLITLQGQLDSLTLQCSCLENPRDGGALWAAVYGVAQSWTRLKRLSSSSSS